jgi:hypothetical protein
MSNQLKSGSIPKNIKMFSRPAEDVKFRWDDIEVEDDIAVVKCFPSFITDSENKKTQATAKSWADRMTSVYNKEKEQWERSYPGFTVKDMPNDPISNVRLIGLDVRGNGGRAWQVLFNDEYLFDMREDVLMDTMLSGGVKEGGVLSGEYIFAAVNSEMKIIRVGSLLHKKMIESTEYNTKSAITKLEIGGIYQNKLFTKMYLGQLYHTPIHVGYEYDGGWSYGRDRNRKVKVEVFPVQKRHVFLELSTRDEFPESGSVQDFKAAIKGSYGPQFTTSTPKSFKNKLGQVSFDTHKELIDSVMDFLKEDKEEHLKNHNVNKDFFWSYYDTVLNTRLEPGEYIHPLIHEEIKSYIK